MQHQDDLRPDAPSTNLQDGAVPTAYDSAVARELLKGLADEELMRIPVLLPGTLTERDQDCLDLADPTVPERLVFAGTIVAQNALLVPRSQVDELLWNKLRGEPAPEPAKALAS